MSSTAAGTSTFHPWPSLPVELKLTILEHTGLVPHNRGCYRNTLPSVILRTQIVDDTCDSSRWTERDYTLHHSSCIYMAPRRAPVKLGREERLVSCTTCQPIPRNLLRTNKEMNALASRVLYMNNGFIVRGDLPFVQRTVDTFVTRGLLRFMKHLVLDIDNAGIARVLKYQDWLAFLALLRRHGHAAADGQCSISYGVSYYAWITSFGPPTKDFLMLLERPANGVLPAMKWIDRRLPWSL